MSRFWLYIQKMHTYFYIHTNVLTYIQNVSKTFDPRWTLSNPLKIKQLTSNDLIVEPKHVKFTHTISRSKCFWNGIDNGFIYLFFFYSSFFYFFFSIYIRTNITLSHPHAHNKVIPIRPIHFHVALFSFILRVLKRKIVDNRITSDMGANHWLTLWRGA